MAVIFFLNPPCPITTGRCPVICYSRKGGFSPPPRVVVRMRGLEPPLRKEHDPKSCASASSATSALYFKGLYDSF